MKKLCVNIFGGPGSGKTTLSASIFTHLKQSKINAELVSEFPKDLVLENNMCALSDQIYVFANQLYRIRCAYDNTQIAVVDSPILLSTIYNPDTSIHLTNLILEQYHRFNNFNILLNRNLEIEHSMMGRVHSITESIMLDENIRSMLMKYQIPHITTDLNAISPQEWAKIIVEQYRHM